MGRRALARLTTKALPDPHELDDGSFVYAGRTVSGKEAAYLRSALGMAKKAGTVSHTKLSHDESIALLAANLARDGIDYARWVRWTLDQMDLYLEGRSIQVERVNVEVQHMIAQAKAQNSDSGLRYTVAIE